MVDEKKKSLHKRFWSIYGKVLSCAWPNFTVVKCSLKIINIYHHKKFGKIIINRCSIEKLFLKILQYSQENTCFGVFFLIKMQAFNPETLLKRDPNTGAFLWILRNFLEHLSWKTSVNDCLNVVLHE